ncbi:M23 family metallopeptidase [Burkholderia sp. GbtcB21]|uniref:M23 family metallopeptidase n=1 Tax=Burkholderia sp. GbtcB21 TaxID=2824766 RepID=UPI001C30EC76|nr:M23 family metallopeptidase [Burkholderia sp. GbtcB21]
MIISPPFLPDAGLVAPTGTNPDPMMDAVDEFECAHGVYPIAFDRRWHCGVHLQPNRKCKVYAIADGEVVAYRVCQHGVDSGKSHTGFVLLKHTTETGEGRTLTFYSLYMHLLPLVEYGEHGADAEEMPEFLRMPTGPVSEGQVTPAVSGEGKKVRRKDVLGWLGKYEDMPHLHFEIFMLPEDFDAYFGRTQLGNSTPTPPAPTETDWWGHAYFVIPAGSAFRRLPEKADARNKLHGIAFKPGHEGSNTLPLLVETYFSLGSKYTNVWSIAQDGTRTLLTPQPVEEKDYEYDLYKRATALYSSCPSDGYELLRFGRILSTDKKLAADACVTWMQVNWAADRVGYIDINDSNIHKFSDADFLSFMGWQKISDGNTPFGSDGLCDVDALKKIVKVAAASERPTVVVATTENQKAAALSSYVKYNDQVRRQLCGFVCNAPGEWDSANNEERYAKLLDEGGYYHGNDKGYNDFMKYLKEVQFWKKTGLPAGQKLWFFHPLAFIRHFRRCGWISKNEFKNIYADNRYSRNQNPIPSQLRDVYLGPLNSATRKYGLTSLTRLAHFLGQGAVESNCLASMQETSMLGELKGSSFYGKVINPASKVLESTLGHWYGQSSGEDDAWYRSEKFNSHGTRITSSYDWRNGNCDRDDSQKFRGRGFKQLTGRSNYADYWTFRGWISSSSFTESWWTDPEFRARNRSGMKKNPAVIDDPHKVALPENSMDSGGFYLRFERPDVAKNIDRDSPGIAISEAGRQRERIISRDVTYAINGGHTDWERRLAFTRFAKDVIS